MAAWLLLQERQAEPGGTFPPQEVEASMRPAVLVDTGKPSKAKRRASAADALDDDDDGMGPPKRKRSYKPRASAGAAAAASMASTEDAGQLDAGRRLPAVGLAKAPPHVLELGMQQPAVQRPLYELQDDLAR